MSVFEFPNGGHEKLINGFDEQGTGLGLFKVHILRRLEEQGV
jgi:hypothetical protein